MSNRAKEIESFYWLLIRIGVAAFGYLMIVGGTLLALAFAVEKLRTGAIAFGGLSRAGAGDALLAIAIPAAVALAGLAMVRAMRRYSREP